MFRQATQFRGDCPLPEPMKDGGRIIDHPQMMCLKPRPKGYDYDFEIKEEEDIRFKLTLCELFKSGEITEEEYYQYLNLD